MFWDNTTLLEMLLSEEEESEEAVEEAVPCPFCKAEARLIDVQEDLNFRYAIYLCGSCGRIFQEKEAKHRYAWLLSNIL